MTFERSKAETFDTTGTARAASTADMGTAPALTLGSMVYTADGDKLGTVKEVRGSAFKVDAKMQPDYWLSFSCARTVTSDRVDLAFPKDRLGDYKLDNPVQG